LSAVSNWLLNATNVAIVESPGELVDDESFIVQLLAIVWARGFVEAARHGLPALRQDRHFHGTIIRGRLDISRSIGLAARGEHRVASVRRERSLNHAASRAIVAAYNVLHRWLGRNDDRWLPARARELLPHLVSITGLRPAIPTKAELRKVHYTPITAGFARVAELSRQIGRHRGLTPDASPEGTCQGILLDVAELWELYVLCVARRAAGRLRVRHGTREDAGFGALLRSERDGSTLGSLRPDALFVNTNEIVGVLDAKYKQLHPTIWASNGPQREDLYQIAAYLSRFGENRHQSWGLLAYPFDAERPEVSQVESRNAWHLSDGGRIFFFTLEHDINIASSKLGNVLQLAIRGVV
jgi:5-methylcytosine-specific restriction enzyme subunit McrC